MRADPQAPQPLHGLRPLRAGPQGGAVPEGPPSLPAGRALRGEGRRDRHRGRVHGAAHVREALLRRAPPGHRGQGARPGGAGEPDPGHHHPAELLPHVPQAGGHDRHRRHGGGGVQGDLRHGGGGGPHPQPHDPYRPPRRDLPDPAGEVQRRGGGGGGVLQTGPACPGGNRLHRTLRAGEQAPEGPQGPPPRPQRQGARQGSGHRGPGGALRRHHRGHQHGRPGHGHPVGGATPPSWPGRRRPARGWTLSRIPGASRPFWKAKGPSVPRSGTG